MALRQSPLFRRRQEKYSRSIPQTWPQKQDGRFYLKYNAFLRIILPYLHRNYTGQQIHLKYIYRHRGQIERLMSLIKHDRKTMRCA